MFLGSDNMHICAYNQPVSFEWDYLKAVRNLQKHNVDFADAVTALDGTLAITIREETSGEGRFVTLVTDALGRLLAVVYTWRGGSDQGHISQEGNAEGTPTI